MARKAGASPMMGWTGRSEAIGEFHQMAVKKANGGSERPPRPFTPVGSFS
jgi:hypothetical protein